MNAGAVVGIIIAILALVALWRALVIVRQYERGLVERLGKYKETLEPGLRFLIPFIDRMAGRVDMREMVLDIEPQPVITMDNVTVPRLLPTRCRTSMSRSANWLRPISGTLSAR